MLDFVEGVLLHKTPTAAVVAVGGIGFTLTIPTSTFERLPRSGTVRIHTHLAISESDLRLFGFSTEPERRLFRLLLTVQGVGPQTALGIISGVSVREFRRAVLDQDPAPLLKARGVGRKTADRILLELKEAVEALPEPEGPAGPDRAGRTRQDALLALLALGVPRPRAEEAVRRALHEASKEAVPDAGDLTKAALRHV